MNVEKKRAAGQKSEDVARGGEAKGKRAEKPANSPSTKARPAGVVQEAAVIDVCGGVGRCLGVKGPPILRLGFIGASDGCQLPTETKYFDTTVTYFLRHTNKWFNRFKVRSLGTPQHRHTVKGSFLGLLYCCTAARPLLPSLQVLFQVVFGAAFLCTRMGPQGDGLRSEKSHKYGRPSDNSTPLYGSPPGNYCKCLSTLVICFFIFIRRDNIRTLMGKLELTLECDYSRVHYVSQSSSKNLPSSSCRPSSRST